MGGIKNKLKQLSNKVANLVFSARLGSSVRRSLLDGVDNKTFNLASTARGGGLRSKPVGLLSITKYASIACFTLALISTIGLNLYRTYSSSNVRTNAVDGSTNSELAAQADIDPASISISISSYPSSSSTGGNNPNLSLSIPRGGGIATGRHTVIISVGSDVQEYRARFSSKTEETALVNESNSNTKIPAIDTFYVDGDGSTEDLERVLAATPGNLWAYSYEEHGKAPAITSARVDALPPASSPDIFQYDLNAVGTSSTDINYGVKVEHPESMPAGNYIANIVYTATVEQLRRPILTSVTPNTYELGSGADNTITITGKYLSTASKAYLVHASTGEQYYCTNLQVTSTDANGNATLTCNIPTGQTDPNIEPGTYGVYVLTNAGETAYTDAATFTYTKSSICRNADPGSDCQVDIDDNMIPVVYEGYDGNGGGNWRIVTKEEIENDKGSWYDYDNKQWANAITLRDDNKGGVICANSSNGVVGFSFTGGCAGPGDTAAYTPLKYAKAVYEGRLPNGGVAGNSLFTADTSSTENGHGGTILGYWVYIPRYAYQVMRRDASNGAVSAQNFNIVFETKDNPVKQPVECSAGNYQSCVENQYGESGLTYPNTTSQSDPLNSKTAWATHPAFTWMDADGNPVELNGIWVGKFETTGSTSQPTILPNQKHMSQSSGNIGDMYDVAKSIGVEDKNNVYGNSAQTSYNNGRGYHNLAISTSHMLKNSEWGAVAYLSASRYGAGVNNVQINANASSGNDGNGDSSYGVTGCGPDGSSQYNTENGQLASTTNNIYGVYDMAGGAYEYVMGSYTNDSTQSYPSNDYIVNKVKPPYVDLYVNPPFNGNKDTNNNLCTWTTCGGHALFETAGWGDDYSYFVHSSNPWFLRGGYANADSAGTGVFYSGASNGRTLGSNSFRVGLAALSAM